jgi:hypothetical protein
MAEVPDLVGIFPTIEHSGYKGKPEPRLNVMRKSQRLSKAEVGVAEIMAL